MTTARDALIDKLKRASYEVSQINEGGCSRLDTAEELLDEAIAAIEAEQAAPEPSALVQEARDEAEGWKYGGPRSLVLRLANALVKAEAERDAAMKEAKARGDAMVSALYDITAHEFVRAANVLRRTLWPHAQAEPPQEEERCAYRWSDGSLCGATFQQGCHTWEKDSSYHRFVPPAAPVAEPPQEEERCAFMLDPHESRMACGLPRDHPYHTVRADHAFAPPSEPVALTREKIVAAILEWCSTGNPLALKAVDREYAAGLAEYIVRLFGPKERV